MFWCIWDRFVTALNSVQMGQSGAINAKVCATMSRTTNVPDPHHWTLNSCFSVFRNVWVQSGPFLYCTKLGAKWDELVELMQKFMPRSCVWICRNKRTRSTPLDKKLMFFLCFVVFGCISDHSVTAWNSMQNGLNWCNYCKSSSHEVISELFAKNAPDPPRWTLN